VRGAFRLAASVLAFNRGDLPGHLAIYDESIQSMTKSGPRPGIAPIEKAFREDYFKDGLRSLAPDAALATARFVLSGGGKPDRARWFTLVWLRTPAGWRAVRDHSS